VSSASICPQLERLPGSEGIATTIIAVINLIHQNVDNTRQSLAFMKNLPLKIQTNRSLYARTNINIILDLILDSSPSTCVHISYSMETQIALLIHLVQFSQRFVAPVVITEFPRFHQTGSLFTQSIYAKIDL